NIWPPLPGVTPATTDVPYSSESRAWRAPKLPVMPCTRTLVSGVTRIAMYRKRLLRRAVSLVDANRIALGIQHERHPAHRRRNRLHPERHAGGPEMRYRGIEI